jgi:hypothetical protein
MVRYQQFQENMHHSSQGEIPTVPGKPCTTLLIVRYHQFQENMHRSSQGEIPTVPGKPCTILLMVRYQQFQKNHSSVGVYSKYCY